MGCKKDTSTYDIITDGIDGANFSVYFWTLFGFYFLVEADLLTCYSSISLVQDRYIIPYPFPLFQIETNFCRSMITLYYEDMCMWF